MRAHPFASVGRVEGHGVLHPDVRFLGRLDDGVQGSTIVGILASIHREDVVADRRDRTGVTMGYLDPHWRRHGCGQRSDVLGETEPVIRRAVERLPGIVIGKHVHRFVPRASEKGATILPFIPAPFLLVAGHVEGGARPVSPW
jgi:hypothetical protein